jgi:hypothetical protein
MKKLLHHPTRLLLAQLLSIRGPAYYQIEMLDLLRFPWARLAQLDFRRKGDTRLLHRLHLAG